MLQLIPLSAQATDSGSSRKIPHLEVHGGHVKRSRLLGACFSKRSVSHREHMFFISSGSSPQKKDTEGILLSGSQTALFCVTQPQRSSRRSFRCSGGILVLFIALVVASLSTPAVDSLPLMSLRLFPRFFSIRQASVPCLISWSHQLSGPSSSLQVGKAHPLQNAVYCSRWPITHLTTMRIATPNTLHLRTGLWPLLRHASQLSQDSGMKHSARDRRGDLLMKSVSTISRHLLRRPERVYQPEGKNLPAGKPYIACRPQPSTQSSWLSIEAAKVPNECVWRW